MTSGFRKPAAFPQSDVVGVDREASTSGEKPDIVALSPSLSSSSPLPILDHSDEIVYALEKHPVLVVVGETGCGKSTQIPRILDRAGWTQKGQCIVCTQPRRLAAISLSKRVSEEMNVTLGQKVGYSVRFDEHYDKQGVRTAIKYVTDLMLIRETLYDPLLSRYSVVIVDEAHERSLQSDVLLGLLKKILQQRKSDFKVIVSSATLDVGAFQDFFELVTGGADSKHRQVCVLNTSGSLHPVDTVYLRRPCANYVTEAVDTVLSIHAREAEGDILCFLPGAGDVEEALGALEDRLGVDSAMTLTVIPLHDGIPASAQMRVFEREKVTSARPPRRRCIMSTSMGETSITVPGVRYVVDSGYTQSKYYDVRSGVESLTTRLVSRAEAAQRKGRAGRTGPGRCFRLLTEEFYLHSPDISDFPAAEMQRVDVTWVVLQLKALGIDDVLHFDFLSPPSPASLIHAFDMLYSLGALDEHGTLTTTGRRMADLPLNPQLSKCLLSSLDQACGVEMLAVCAMCSVGHPFYRPHNARGLTRSYLAYRALKGPASAEGEPTKAVLRKFLHERVCSLADTRTGDHLTLLAVYRAFEENGASQQWCELNCVHYRVMLEAKSVRTNLYRILREYEQHQGGQGADKAGKITTCGENTEVIRKCLVSGLFANAAKLGADGRYHTIKASLPVRLHPASALLLRGTQPDRRVRGGGGFRGAGEGGTPPEWILYNEVLSTTLTSSLAASDGDGAWAGVKDVVVVREACAIHPRWLVELASHYYQLHE